MRYLLRVFVRIVAILAVTVPGIAVTMTVVTAKSGAQDELALGPETGFFFYWDPNLVSLEEEFSDPGYDYWKFQSDESAIEIWAFEDANATPESCINDFLDDLAATSDVVNVQALPAYGGGAPQIVGNSAPIVITFDDGKKLAADVTCQAVTGGESFALAFIYMLAEDYNERAQESNVPGAPDYSMYISLIEAIDLSVHNALLDPDATVVSIPSGNGASGVDVRTFLPCNVVVFDLLVGGYGDDGPVTFDPASLVAIDAEGERHPISAATWAVPQARRGSVLELAPGEYGLVHGVVGLPELENIELYVESPTGEQVFLARSVLGCGESGAAPVLIDIE